MLRDLYTSRMKTIWIILSLLRENFDTWKIFKKNNVGQFWQFLDQVDFLKFHEIWYCKNDLNLEMVCEQIITLLFI